MNDNMSPGSVSGVVVLYHPDASIEKNIQSYLPDLDFLTIIDNSPAPAPWFERLAATTINVRYHWNGGVNAGLASALNEGAAAALQRGDRWLLTMDQDSSFPEGELKALISRAREEAHGKVGIVSPWHEVVGMPHRKMPEKSAEVLYAFTSGNLLNLKAYLEAGPFLEKFFIDYIDFEYCLRLRKFGYATLSVPVPLRHPLGEIRARGIPGFLLYPGNRSPIRYYYMFRNRLYVWRHYPAAIPHDAGAGFKTLLGVLFYENNKARKLAFIGRGIFDFFRGRYGAYRGRP